MLNPTCADFGARTVSRRRSTLRTRTGRPRARARQFEGRRMAGKFASVAASHNPAKMCESARQNPTRGVLCRILVEKATFTRLTGTRLETFCRSGDDAHGITALEVQ